MSGRMRENLSQFKKLMETHRKDLHDILSRDSAHSREIALLQRLLNDLGYGGKNFQNDGDYCCVKRNLYYSIAFLSH